MHISKWSGREKMLKRKSKHDKILNDNQTPDSTPVQRMFSNSYQAIDSKVILKHD